MASKEEVMLNMDLIVSAICDNSELERKVVSVGEEVEIIAGMLQNLISKNAYFAQDQDEYEQQYNSLMNKYESKKAELDDLNKQLTERRNKATLIKAHKMALLKQKELLTEFDGSLWAGLVESLIVYSKEDIRVKFKDGTVVAP